MQTIGPQSAGAEQAVRTPTVLLVDDDSKLLQALRRMLHGQPYQILAAHDGREAIHLLKSRTVELIVSDEHMPGMHGTELLA